MLPRARLGLVLILLVAACAPMAKPPSPAPTPTPVPTAPVLPPLPAMGGDAEFQAFIRDFEPTAIAQGITPETYNKAMAGVAPIASIQQVMDNQPEFAKQIWSYLDAAVSARRVANAKTMLTRYADVLTRIETSSGVPKEILVAIWGMETDYGSSTGDYNLFSSLTTQAWQGPRQQYAARELIAALKLLQQENYPVSEMNSSWAGAFGQTQFMPSTFFKYATDGDGDGKIDLWSSAPDALASTAQLFAHEGWETGKPWFYEVKLPKDFDLSLTDLDETRKLSDWAAMGVQTASGAALPAGDDAAALYLPAGARGPAFMLFDNFRVIMKYNNAAAYALAVGLLADRMAGAEPLAANWPRQERALSRDERVAFQTDLKSLGYDPGAADGVLGRKSRMALKAWQKSKNLPADGFPTAELLAALNADVPAPSDTGATTATAAMPPDSSATATASPPSDATTTPAPLQP